MQTFKTRDGMQVAYYVDDFTDPWTQPDTLLLLHAAMGNSRRWFRWVPPLSRRFRVVRMDLRGHGASQLPAPDQDFSLGHLVGDVLELLDLLKVKIAHVVGNSAGATSRSSSPSTTRSASGRWRSMDPRPASRTATR